MWMITGKAPERGPELQVVPAAHEGRQAQEAHEGRPGRDGHGCSRTTRKDEHDGMDLRS
jgi:hypothetical protein